MFVGPRWDELIVAPMAAEGSSFRTVASIYALLVAMCGGHNLAFVFLGKNGGGA